MVGGLSRKLQHYHRGATRKTSNKTDYKIISG